MSTSVYRDRPGRERRTPWPGLAGLVGLALLLVLGACAPPKPEPVALPADTVEEDARSHVEADRPRSAAALYEEQASFQPSPRREAWQIRSAELWAAAGQPREARRLLEDLDRDTLTPALQDHHAAASGRLAMAEDNPDAALDHVADLPGPETPDDVALTVLELRLDAYETLGDVISMLDVRMTLHGRLPEGPERGDNARALIETMAGLEPEILEEYQGVFEGREAQGWLRLGELAARHDDAPRVLAGELVRWRSAYPASLIDGELAYWIGRVHLLREEPTKAVTALELAIERGRGMPFEAEAHYRLAEAHAAQGDTDTARRTLRSLLQSDLAGPFRDRAHQRLDALSPQ